MSEKIGLEHCQSIDKISISTKAGDQTFRLSIGQFQKWEDIHNPVGKLKEKVSYYVSAIKSGQLMKMYPEIKGRRAQITLMTYEPLPSQINEVFSELKQLALEKSIQMDHLIINKV